MPDTVKSFDHVIPIKMTPCACQAQSVLHRLVSHRLISLFFPRKIPHHLVALLLKRDANQRLVVLDE
jgi:hypothetical protein